MQNLHNDTGRAGGPALVAAYSALNTGFYDAKLY